MSVKYFLDTNILIYTFDKSDPKKQSIATELVEEALKNYSGMISTQVVQEFLNVATRKFASRLSPGQAKEYLRLVLYRLCTVSPSIELYNMALAIAEDSQHSFYDSLIVAAAIQAGCKILYSEDMQDDHQIKGLKIKNPF